jgi:hypothetical protein
LVDVEVFDRRRILAFGRVSDDVRAVCRNAEIGEVREA